MKKFFRTILPLSLFAMTLASCGENVVTDTTGGSADSSVPAAPTHDYDLKIWAAENAKALTEKQAKPRRTRRAKKDKAAAPAEGTQKTPRRRRTRKMVSAAIPVTGMLDSAE